MKFIALFDKKFRPKWDYIKTIPEFKALETTKQSETWHQEGSVFNHIVLVCQELEKILVANHINRGSYEWRLLMSAAICHDLGKATTTKWDKEKNDWSTKCHGHEGACITRRLFWDESNFFFREDVCYMVRHHMDLHHIFDKGADVGARNMMKLSWGRVPVRFMSMLNEADSRGSINEKEDDEFLKAKYERIKNTATSLDCWEDRYFINTTTDRYDFFLNRDRLWPKSSDNCVTHRHPICYVMIGLPGSGKDTYINENFGPEVKRLCRDEIRTEIGIAGEKPMGNKEQEDEVTRIFNERMTEYIGDGETFVVNNTMLRRQYREEILRAVMGHDYHVIYVYVEAPSIDENKKRRDGTIPPKVIDRMSMSFDFPEPWEYQEIRYELQREDPKPNFKQYKMPETLNRLMDTFSRLIGGESSVFDYLKDRWGDFTTAEQALFVEGFGVMLTDYFEDFNKLSLFHKKHLFNIYRKTSLDRLNRIIRKIGNKALKNRLNNLGSTLWKHTQREINKVDMLEARTNKYSLIPLSVVKDKLEAMKGAMILDGYEAEHICVWFVNDLIKELDKVYGTSKG